MSPPVFSWLLAPCDVEGAWIALAPFTYGATFHATAVSTTIASSCMAPMS